MENSKKVKYKDKIIADRGFVLSLPDRTDRREYVSNVLNELEITGWEYEDGVRFDDPDWRRYGCTQAYVNMFKKAIDDDCDNIIVFEDDIKKMNTVNHIELDNIFTDWLEKTKKYDLIALGTRPLWESTIIKESETLGCIDSFLCTQSFFFNREFINYAYDKLSCYKDSECEHYRVVIDEFLSDCSSEKNIHKTKNKIFKAGITIPMIFTQGPSFSDNELNFMNYETWIEDSFWNAIKDKNHLVNKPQELRKLGELYGTDKVTHGFLEYYETLLSHLKNEKINFLEIGVFYGSSIKMWNDYFVHGKIFGMDTFIGVQGNGHTFENPKQFLEIWKNSNYGRIELIECDQSKEKELKDFVRYCVENHIYFDVILDDGSHNMFDQQITLDILFDLVKPGGYYIIEDIHSSDWYPYHGIAEDRHNTTKNVLLNYKKTKKLSSPYIKNIERIKYLEDNFEQLEHFTSDNRTSQVIVIKKK